MNTYYLQFGIDTNNLDRLFIKQNSAFISCTSSLLLLTFLEKIIGTNEIIININEYNNDIKTINNEILDINTKISNIITSKKDIEPTVKQIYKLYHKKYLNDSNWYKYYSLLKKNTEINLNISTCNFTKTKCLYDICEEQYNLEYISYTICKNERLNNSTKISHYSYMLSNLNKYKNKAENMLNTNVCDIKEKNKCLVKFQKLYEDCISQVFI